MKFPQSLSRKTLLNSGFAAFSAVLLLILLRAPEETTTPLPRNAIHEEFHAIASRKEAERHCGECHSPSGAAPLPADHPDPYRCLFCHKRGAGPD